MSDENSSSKTWILYCILFFTIIVFAVLYGIELIKHSDSKDASEMRTCVSKLEKCDFELLMVDKKFTSIKRQRDLCLNNTTNASTEIRAILDFSPSQDEPLVPSNHQNYKYYMSSGIRHRATEENVMVYIISSFLFLANMYFIHNN